MNKNTMFYGLLAVGGVLAYYAWKQHSLSTEQNSESGTTTPLSHTSGIFVDDVPVSPSVLGIPASSTPIGLVDTLKNKVSQIVEPFISTQKQNELTGQGNFADA